MNSITNSNTSSNIDGNIDTIYNIEDISSFMKQSLHHILIKHINTHCKYITLKYIESSTGNKNMIWNYKLLSRNHSLSLKFILDTVLFYKWDLDYISKYREFVYEVIEIYPDDKIGNGI